MVASAIATTQLSPYHQDIEPETADAHVFCRYPCHF